MTEGTPAGRSTLCPLLIGRGPYIEILRQFCEQVRLGQGQTVILAGEAGIGKSRLAAEVKSIARQAGFTVLQSNCRDAECGLPYGPFLRLLPRLLAGPTGLAEPGQPYAPQLMELLPELRRAWPDLEAAPRQDDEQARAGYYSAISGLLTRQPAPLLLVIEDLHWCDEASLEFLLQFARRLVGHPILLLLTYRSDEAQPALRPLVAELERTQLAVELNLTRLPRADVAFMIRVIFEQARPVRPELSEAIHTLTHGNPLFIEEALQAMVAAGELYQANGTWTHLPLAGLALPRTVQSAVQRRLARLSAGAQELLNLAAVAARPLDAGLIQALVAVDSLPAQLDELREAQLVTVEADGSFAPRHHLLGQAVYSGLLARERQALHSRVLAGLAALGATADDAHLPEAAEHAFQAGQWVQAAALARRAGERARALHWPRAAVDHFSRALEAARRLDRAAPASLYHARGQVLEQLGEFEAARLDYEQESAAARLARDPRGEWQSLIDLGFLWQARDPAQAGAYFERAFTQAYTLNDPVVLSFGRRGPAQSDDFETMAGSFSPAPARETDQHALAATLDLLGAASYLSGDIVSGTDYFRQAIALFRSLPDQMGLASSLMHIALGATLDTESPEVDLGEAVRYGEEALALARSNGWRSEQAHVLSELAIGYGRQGEYARAFELAEHGLALASTLEQPALISYALTAKGSLYADIFAAEEARRPLEQALTIAEGLASQHLACFAARYAALALLECGAQVAEIAAVLDRAQRVGPTASADMSGTQTLSERTITCARAQLALANGEAARALELVTGLIAPAAPPWPGGGAAGPERSARPASVTLLLLRGEALSALREPAKAEAALRLAQRAAVEQGALPSLWRVHAALGKHYLRFKQRTAANTEFEQARAFLHGLAERIPPAELREQFLRQTRHLAPPAAPQPPQPAGKREFGGLTERERETVALIAEGKSNREIAAHLVVSDETVKTHVSHILSKLGLRSRTQIAAWAIQHGLTTHI